MIKIRPQIIRLYHEQLGELQNASRYYFEHGIAHLLLAKRIESATQKLAQPKYQFERIDVLGQQSVLGLLYDLMATSQLISKDSKSMIW